MAEEAIAVAGAVGAVAGEEAAAVKCEAYAVKEGNWIRYPGGL